MAALLDASRIEEYPPGLELVAEGEPAPDWYCVLETGAVQISRLDVESEEILDSLTAGDVLDPGTPGLPAACSARGHRAKPLLARPAIGRRPAPATARQRPGGRLPRRHRALRARGRRSREGPTAHLRAGHLGRGGGAAHDEPRRRRGRGGGSRWRTDRHRDRSRPARQGDCRRPPADHPRDSRDVGAAPVHRRDPARLRCPPRDDAAGDPSPGRRRRRPPHRHGVEP